jgi:hypothetical protein
MSRQSRHCRSSRRSAVLDAAIVAAISPGSGIGGRSRCEGRARWSSMMRSKRSDNASAFPSMASATAFRVAPRLRRRVMSRQRAMQGSGTQGARPRDHRIGLSKVAFRGSLHLNLQAGFRRAWSPVIQIHGASVRAPPTLRPPLIELGTRCMASMVRRDASPMILSFPPWVEIRVNADITSATICQYRIFKHPTNRPMQPWR